MQTSCMDLCVVDGSTGMGMGAEIVYVVVARSLCVVGGSDGK